MRLVLDPSVVVKWYVPEPGWEDAWELKAWLQVGPRHVMVPDLFVPEISNVLWKKSRLLKEISRDSASNILKEVLALPFQILPAASFILEAFQIAHRHRVAVYDALYVALAVQQRCALVTADDALSRRLEKSSLSRHVVSLVAWKAKL